jgi:hypothetical protein
MKSYAPFLLFLLLSISVFAADTEKLQVAIPAVGRPDSAPGAYFNPFLIAGASLVVPGAGQMYTKHFIKGGMFLASEAIAVSIATSMFNDSKRLKNSTKTFLLRAELDTGISRINGFNNAEFSKYSERVSRYRGYNSVAWASGLYVYNMLDAFECSNIIDKSGSRSPLKAGLLSAIPGLGMGQWYNGSISRAGLIFMGQMSMGVMVVNYHRLMTNAGDQYEKVKTEYDKHIVDAFALGQDTSALSSNREKYLDSWESERSSAFSSRNTWLWYSIFFYFYGILDAVVDAHLHDYPEKMHMYPDLVPQGDGALLRLNVNF